MHLKSIRIEADRCYRVLELESGASPEAVRDAWRDLIKVWHPDRFPNDQRLQAKGQARLKEFNHARKFLEEYLSNPHSSQLRRHETGAPESRRTWMRRWSVIAVGIAASLALTIVWGARFSLGSRLAAAGFSPPHVLTRDADASVPAPEDRFLQLVALAPVRVSAHAVADGQIVLSEIMMTAGQTITLPAHGAIYVKYSAGENLQLQINGVRYGMPTSGPDRAKINPDPR
jgi:hypothetical protein